MTDYIERKAVLEILASKNAPWDGYQKVSELPAADVQPVKWIPVTERLPGIGERVITYRKGYGVKENFRSGDGTWWSGFKITHWMPLPEPPID